MGRRDPPGDQPGGQGGDPCPDAVAAASARARQYAVPVDVGQGPADRRAELQLLRLSSGTRWAAAGSSFPVVLPVVLPASPLPPPRGDLEGLGAERDRPARGVDDQSSSSTPQFAPAMIASRRRSRRVDLPRATVTEAVQPLSPTSMTVSAGPAVPLLPLVTFRPPPAAPAIAAMPPGGRRSLLRQRRQGKGPILLGITVVFRHARWVAAAAARHAGPSPGPRLAPAGPPPGLRGAVAAARRGRPRTRPGPRAARRDRARAADGGTRLEARDRRAVHEGRPLRRHRPAAGGTPGTRSTRAGAAPARPGAQRGPGAPAGRRMVRAGAGMAGAGGRVPLAAPRPGARHRAAGSSSRPTTASGRCPAP